MDKTNIRQDRRLGDFASVDTADTGDLVARLDAMHDLDTFKSYKEETFSLLLPIPGSMVADVGCGTGEDVCALAQRVGAVGHVIGFDLSEAMLSEARERHSSLSSVSFQQAPSQTLPAPENHFDAIRADRVLIHVPDPVATIREMVRVLKPGGRLVISEPDMPGCWVASSNYPLTSLVMEQIASSCAAPYLARDLWTLFHDAGLADVRLVVRTVTVFDPASVATILDFEGVLKRMLVAGALSAGQVDAWLAEFAERGRTGRFAAGVCIFIVSAIKQ